MPTRPRKPWRVVLNRKELPAGDTQEDFTSERAAYDHAVEQHGKAKEGQTEVTSVHLFHWVDGRWILHEDFLDWP